MAALVAENAVFLVVGAHAVGVHGVPRATGDLDILIRPDAENGKRVWRALVQFGAPVEVTGLTPTDLEKPDMVYQIGLPPRRIDILTEISGVDFEEAWSSRVTSRVGDLEIPFIGKDALLRNKRASGRPKDLADIDILERREPSE
ncbi:MAG TPA: hypothetical protein VEL74_22665 [Thermoanaerobaculia bacterium]|nr:hypothetical protein [Thermoanaerobaculia bacterium]